LKQKPVICQSSCLQRDYRAKAEIIADIWGILLKIAAIDYGFAFSQIYSSTGIAK
jgi:hypothetical protein